MRRVWSRRQPLGVKRSMARSTTGWRPASMSISAPSISSGATQS
ncbi:Uncharacterised protein [Bordetella pertussis]|nr:Uncharacterised protein [Bordetella pertussis]